MERSNNLQRPSLLNVVRVAAVISYFTARSIHLRKESSKLLLLAPHNDTIDDLEGLMGAAAPDYPPTLYDFYLACIYRQELLADNLDKFQFTNHQGTLITPVAQAVSTLAIHKLISADPTLQATLESRASLSTIVNIALTYPRGFVTYCTISNTVKAIGIGGSASLFVSAKFTSFIAASEEADARNLVALTRSKGVSVILLPPATQFVASPLHSLLTQCAFRHGIFNIGADDLDIEALAGFLSQPDTTQAGDPALYTSASWLHTHQISTFGTWDLLPLCLALTYNSYNAQISYFYLSLNQHLPPSNTHTITAAHFEWSGKLFGSPPTPATISFGRNCLLLVTEHSRIVEFRYPTATDTLIEARGFGLRPVSGSYFFARPSHGLGHKHPIRASTPNPPPPLPLTIQRWPPSSPATFSPDLPEYEDPPPQHFCQPTPNNCTNWALIIYTPKNVSTTPHLSPKIGSPLTALKLFQTLPSKSWAPSWTHLHSMNLHQKLLSPSPTAMIPRTFIIISTAHCQLKKWIGLSLSLDTEQWLIPPLPRTIWSGSSHATNFPPQVAG